MREAAAVTVLALMTACSTPDAYPSGRVIYYWDQPETGWYWVPKGTEVPAIVAAAKRCGAVVDGSVATHGIVPPGYDVGVFKFLEPSPADARNCTIKEVRAFAALSVHERKK